MKAQGPDDKLANGHRCWSMAAKTCPGFAVAVCADLIACQCQLPGFQEGF